MASQMDNPRVRLNYLSLPILPGHPVPGRGDGISAEKQIQILAMHDNDLPTIPTRAQSRHRIAVANDIPDRETCQKCKAQLMPHDWDDFLCNKCQGLPAPIGKAL